MNFKTAKSAETFERVLAAAGTLFRRKGFAGATMRELASESQLGLGALYYYFRSKEELVLVFYERINQQSLLLFQEQTSRDLAGAMGDFLQLKLQLLTPHRDLMRVIMKEAIDPESPLCPLNPAAAAPLNLSLGVFSEMTARFEGLQGRAQTERARMLWLIHMAVLGYWLHDRSPNYKATLSTLGTLASFLKLSSLALKIPGMRGFQTRLSGHISDLFDGPGGNNDTG